MDITSDGEDPPESNITVDGNGVVDESCTNYLQYHTRRVLELLDVVESEISIRVVDDAEMATLHENHSDETGTTDVLTFEHSVNDQAIVADIAICSCVAGRATKNREHKLRDELLLYIVHGILHCIGFDDHSDKSHIEMHIEEDRILTALGIGKVWSRNHD